MSFLLSPLSLDPAQVKDNHDVPRPALVNPQPKVVENWTAAGGVERFVGVDIDLLADTVIDVVGVLFHTMPEAQFRLDARTQVEGPFVGPNAQPPTIFNWNSVPQPTIKGARQHSLRRLEAPITVRYMRLWHRFTLAVTGTVSVGVVAVGRGWQPQNTGAGPGVDWGAGRRIVDLSDVRTLDGGEGAVWQKARVPEARFGWSNLTDAELRDLWAIASAHGESRPLLFVEDAALTAGQQERIHYGTLRNVGFYERLQSDKSRWEATIRGWQ